MAVIGTQERDRGGLAEVSGSEIGEESVELEEIWEDDGASQVA